MLACHASETNGMTMQAPSLIWSGCYILSTEARERNCEVVMEMDGHGRMVTLICAAVLIGCPRKLDRALFLGLPTWILYSDPSLHGCHRPLYLRSHHMKILRLSPRPSIGRSVTWSSYPQLRQEKQESYAKRRWRPADDILPP